MVLDVITRQENDVTVVALKGRLTLGNLLVNTENKMRSLIEQGPRKIVLDLSELEYMDSAGIGMLMMCAGTARNSGSTFHIAGPNDRIKKIFEIAHVAQVIPIYPDVASATAAFA